MIYTQTRAGAERANAREATAKPQLAAANPGVWGAAPRDMELEPPKPGKKKTASEVDEEVVVPTDMTLAVLAYLPVLCLVAVIHPKRESFVAFHTRQGLCLFLLELAAVAIYFLPAVGPGLALALAIACVAIAVHAIRAVRRRARWSIPLISTLADHVHI